MPDRKLINARSETDGGASAVAMQKWGGLALFLLAVAFSVSRVIYLVGDLRTAIGPLAYSLADFLYGPVWAASLVTAVCALRERLGEYGSRRMSLALRAAILAAGAMVAVACIRSANREYHLMHPELNLENSTDILIVWTTLVAGMTGVGWHFLGWAQVLIGSTGWTSRRLPRLLSGLYMVGGTVSLFVYVLPSYEEAAVALGVVLSIWQGLLLWNAGSGETPLPEIKTGQPNQA